MKVFISLEFVFLHSGMSREQIRRVPRHTFAPANRRQLRRFGVRGPERRLARQALRNELQPRNVLTGNAGLITPVDRNIGFNLNSLPANKKKRSLLRRMENSMRDRWMARIAKIKEKNGTVWAS